MRPPAKADSVQYGCGWTTGVSWLNFDSSPTLRIEKFPVIGRFFSKNEQRFPDNAIYGDITRGLPVQPGTISRLYASHVLEHLSYTDAINAIGGSFQMLKPGGVFRLIVPDLKVRAEKYVKSVNRSAAANDFMRSTSLGEERRPRGLRGLLVAALGGSAHRWMWDESSLTAALREAGFVEVRRCSFGDSGDPIFAEVERLDRFIDGDIVELAMQCRRPAL